MKRLLCFLACFMMIAGLLPTAQAAHEEKREVWGLGESTLSVYRDVDGRYEVIGSLAVGEEVLLLKTGFSVAGDTLKRTFSLIQHGTLIGYVDAAYLRVPPFYAVPALVSTPTGLGAVLLSGIDGSGQAVATLPRGTAVEVIKPFVHTPYHDSLFHYVRVGDLTGYIGEEFLYFGEGVTLADFRQIYDHPELRDKLMNLKAAKLNVVTTDGFRYLRVELGQAYYDYAPLYLKRPARVVLAQLPCGLMVGSDATKLPSGATTVISSDGLIRSATYTGPTLDKKPCALRVDVDVQTGKVCEIVLLWGA